MKVDKHMKIMTAYQFRRHELKRIDVFAPSTYNPSEHGGEPWIDALIYLAYTSNNKELLYCLDGDGTTCGDTDGANILIQARDLSIWTLSAQAIGALVKEVMTALEPGKYGDDYASIDLAHSNEFFYWIDESVSPAVAVAKNSGQAS